jgi:hypothetical protein
VKTAKVPPSTMILPDRQLNNVELDRVAEAAGLVLSVRQRARLARAMIEYHDSVAIWQAAPGPKEVRGGLAEIAQKALTLRDALAPLSAGADVVTDGAVHDALVARFTGGVTLAEVRRLIAYLENAAGLAANDLDGRGGPKGDPYLAGLITEIHAVYLDAGGVGKVSKTARGYASPFFDMARAALAVIGGDRHTNAALGHAIESALSRKPVRKPA